MKGERIKKLIYICEGQIKDGFFFGLCNEWRGRKKWQIGFGKTKGEAKSNWQLNNIGLFEKKGKGREVCQTRMQ